MLGWLVKLAVVLLVLGVIAFDGLSVAAAHVNQADLADRAALAASDQWESSHSLQEAYRAAESTAQESGARVLTRRFVGDPDGTIHLILRCRARTVLLRHIGPLRKWAVITTDGVGQSVS